MKVFLFVLSLVFLSSCTTPCDKPTSVAGLITGSLSSVGRCKEPGAQLISADVNKVVGGLGLCSNNKAGMIASIACTPVISALGKISGQALDAKYPGCDFTDALVQPEMVLIELCNQLPF